MEHGGLLMPPLGVGAFFVVFDPRLSLGFCSWRGGWTGAFESLGSDHLFHMARADSPRLFGVRARARFLPAQADLLQEATKLAFPVLSSVTGDEQALSAAHTADCLVEARWRLCASPSHRSTLFARQSPSELSLSGCLTLLPR